MFNSFADLKRNGSIVVVLLSIFAIFLSGIFFALTYFLMDTVETQFQAMDCVIPNNVYVSTCQELWDLSVYPFFALKDILIWASYFFIFAMTLGLLVLGYRSGKNPTLLGLIVIFVIVLTYIGIEVSNIYRTLIEVDIMRTMLIEFPVYNKIMLYFPWYTFFIGMLSLALAIVNYQRIKPNLAEEELNY